MRAFGNKDTFNSMWDYENFWSPWSSSSGGTSGSTLEWSLPVSTLKSTSILSFVVEFSHYYIYPFNIIIVDPNPSIIIAGHWMKYWLKLRKLNRKVFSDRKSLKRVVIMHHLIHSLLECLVLLSEAFLN